MENKIPSIVYIHQDDQDRIKKLVQETPNAETGGNLFGLWTHDGNFVLKVVTGPGSNSRRTRSYGEYTKRVEEFLKSHHMLCRVGEWQFRPYASLEEPSYSEANVIRNNMPTAPLWFLFLMVTTDYSKRLKIRPFFISKQSLRPGDLKILAIPNPYMKNTQLQQTLKEEGRSVTNQYAPSSYTDNVTAVVSYKAPTPPAVAPYIAPTSPAVYSNTRSRYQERNEDPYSNYRTTAIQNDVTQSAYQNATRGSSTRSARSSRREADVKENQWYSSEDGQEILKQIMKSIKDSYICRQSEIEMSRDEQSHDLQLSFGTYNNANMMLDFPADFPRSNIKVRITSRYGIKKDRQLPISKYSTGAYSIARDVASGCQNLIR